MTLRSGSHGCFVHLKHFMHTSMVVLGGHMVHFVSRSSPAATGTTRCGRKTGLERQWSAEGFVLQRPLTESRGNLGGTSVRLSSGHTCASADQVTGVVGGVRVRGIAFESATNDQGPRTAVQSALST